MATPQESAYLPPWQRKFSANNLPIELAVLEQKRSTPKKRSEVPPVQDDNGNTVFGCDDKPLLDFRFQGQQVLPIRIPPKEETWRLIAWQSWAPNVTLWDIAVRKYGGQQTTSELNKETRRLSEAMARWRKARGGLDLQKRPFGAIPKIELTVIDRIKNPPYDWTLNTAYNTVWLVDEEANTVTQPDDLGRLTANVHKLSELGPQQPVSTNATDIRRVLEQRQQEAQTKNTTWDKLEYGDQERHKKRKITLHGRKAQGQSAFRKSSQDDSIPSVQPNRSTERAPSIKPSDTEVHATEADCLFPQDMPFDFDNFSFAEYALRENMGGEDIEDFACADLGCTMPGGLIEASGQDAPLTDLPEANDGAAYNFEEAVGMGDLDASSVGGQPLERSYPSIGGSSNDEFNLPGDLLDIDLSSFVDGPLDQPIDPH